MIALGFLGSDVAWDDAVADPERPEDVEAWVFSVVLADVGSAREKIRKADRWARGSGRRITDKALLRLRAGYAESVVER